MYRKKLTLIQHYDIHQHQRNADSTIVAYSSRTGCRV